MLSSIDISFQLMVIAVGDCIKGTLGFYINVKRLHKKDTLNFKF